MLIVRIVGGLGNQMYGYALYRALLERGRDVVMDLYFFGQKRSPILDKRNSVSVSVRRGDYVNLKCDMPKEYYTTAIKYIRERVSDAKFFFTSDDIEWCKKNFAGNPDFEFVEKSNPDDRFDLCVISECKHDIIANSTFSVWGAWLNKNPNKITIRPDFWPERKDFWPEDWICLKI